MRLRKTPAPNTDLDIYECPKCLSFDDIEVGKEEASFMAMLNAPYQYIRCCKCTFGEKKSGSDLSNDLTGAVIRWNALVEQFKPSSQGRSDEGERE